MRILLTEDNFIVGKSIKQNLENKKYLVDWVQDGESCETALRTTNFDIIILKLTPIFLRKIAISCYKIMN